MEGVVASKPHGLRVEEKWCPTGTRWKVEDERLLGSKKHSCALCSLLLFYGGEKGGSERLSALREVIQCQKRTVIQASQSLHAFPKT